MDKCKQCKQILTFKLGISLVFDKDGYKVDYKDDYKVDYKDDNTFEYKDVIFI